MLFISAGKGANQQLDFHLFEVRSKSGWSYIMEGVRHSTCYCRTTHWRTLRRKTAQKMHWAHANTAANNYSISLITIAYYTKGARLIRVGTPVGRSASQIQTYSSVARPKSGNHAAPRTKQHSTTWPSPPTHQMCRERKTRDSSVLHSCVPSRQGPPMAPAPQTLSLSLSPRKVEAASGWMEMRRGGKMDMWCWRRVSRNLTLKGLREQFILDERGNREKRRERSSAGNTLKAKMEGREREQDRKESSKMVNGEMTVRGGYD